MNRAAKKDPMPARAEPCLALLAAKAPVGEQWAFEVKWDGYRLAIHKEGDAVRILTRGGHDWTHRFPAIAKAAARLAADTLIIDGEGVVLDERGRSDFGALQNALGGRGGKRLANDVIFFAFDLLYRDGQDLRSRQLRDRREMLQPLIPGGAIQFSEELDTDGETFLKIACEMGLEGIIAKRRDSPYQAGRKGEWLKIKCVQSEGFVIIGYQTSSAAFGGIAKLLLAARRGDELVYVGGVGTGFSERTATALRKTLDAIVIPAPAAEVGKKRAVFVQPTFVAEIEFRAWTKDNKLRHASYKGLRDPEDNDSVFILTNL